MKKKFTMPIVLSEALIFTTLFTLVLSFMVFTTTLSNVRAEARAAAEGRFALANSHGRPERSSEAPERRASFLASYVATYKGVFSGGRPAGGGDGTWDNPIIFVLETEAVSPRLPGTLRRGGEEFFLFIPPTDGRLTVETTGSTDTFMHFIDGENRAELASNDDGGAGRNARITQNVQAGRRYIARIRGYSSSTTGNYTLQAAFVPIITDTRSSDSDAPIPYEIGQSGTGPAVNRVLERSGRHYFLITLPADGQLTVETTGGTDTYLEFFDWETGDLLAENDDGGQGRNARISRQVSASRQYIAMIRGFSNTTTGEFAFRAFLEN
ncbi:MAG: hypothetical protein FWG66_14680 [Spirochaetes bacterium]|nr:hypothetical protein [Spirochaetota bacterium]